MLCIKLVCGLDVYRNKFPYVVDNLDTEDAAYTSYALPDEPQATGYVVHCCRVKFGVVSEVLNFHVIYLLAVLICMHVC